MTGRNHTRGKAAGCGNGKGHFNKNNRSGTHKTTTDNKEMKFVLKVACKSQGYTYETVKEHILQELQKTLVSGKEIARNLRKGEDTGIDMPEPKQKIAAKKEMTKEEKREYRKQKEAERAKIRKQREFERERRRIERNK